MRSIRGKDTKPERAVRSILHARGYRFRVHDRRLPGTPDLAFPRRRRAILIHGCFWHQHDAPACPLRKPAPRTNVAYWEPKLRRIRERDAEQEAALRSLGWESLTVWECELREPEVLEERLIRFLGPPRWLG